MADIEIDEEWCTETIAGLLLLITMMFLNAIQLKEETGSLGTTIKFCFLFPVIICMVAVMLILQPVFFVYRMVISIKLRNRYGNNFYGLLSGLDVCVNHPVKQYAMIGILVIFEFDDNAEGQTVLECLKDLVDKNILKDDQLSRMRTTIKSYGGYPFLEYIDMKTEDCVKELPIVDGDLDDAALTRLLGRCQYEPFDGPFLWDVKVGTQPLQTENDRKRYPVMIRVHHALTDGVTLIQLLAGVLGDKPNGTVGKHEKLQQQSQDYLILRLFQFLGKIACVIVYFPSILYSLALIKKDVNDLHQKKMGNDEKVALLFDKGGSYFQKVKNIRRLTGASIPEIICTAYSESLKAHFERYQKKSSRQTTFLLPVVHNPEEIQNMRAMNIKDLNLKNKFSAMTLAIPFSVEKNGYDGNVPLYCKLQEVRRRVNMLKRSMEFYVSNVLFHIIAPSFPGVCLLPFAYFLNNTSIVSLIPGVPKGSYYNGKLVMTDCIFWVPHLMQIDLAFGSFSYDNRLILSFNCDGLYMSQEMAQEILEDVYKNIDLLGKELEYLHKRF
ncbi:hypothetical protein PPYR_10532 [Photinus pyralis]|uniref:Uncharacterized protein n=1 Tax=Photinus pyralis TaxID=7054 RepID=A0A5N4AGM6_PHOPY|nr:uncharacterized protein LOC116172958 [Photinus pyralis]KAB0796471.1 hypothetical protein PPYR_10532 [Photinus pyralis]